MGTAPNNGLGLLVGERPAEAQDLETCLMGFGDDSYREYSRYRFAEEREWYESALFYQRRQWLKWDDSARRWQTVKQNASHPKPMPVSNYFAQTVNANATQLAGSPVRMTAVANDDSDENRRAAQAAEKSLDAIDRESGFRVLQPLLAKHVVLWGMGVTKDLFDSSRSNGRTKVPRLEQQTAWKLGCANCGGTYDIGEPSAPPQPMENLLLARSSMQEQCPNCGSQTTMVYPQHSLAPAEVNYFSRGRIVTEVRPIFEMYLPRDCQNPNLAKRIVQRYRKGISELRRLYPDVADKIKAEGSADIHQVYMEALRSLVNYNYLHEQTTEATNVTEVWADWDELPKKVQEKLENGLADDPEKLEQCEEYGIYEIYASGTMLDWGPNFLEGKKPYTFYLWEVDPANPYPKGLGIDISPLQKRLNRCDSLIELGMMCNAAGKWLWPMTQTTKPPTGSPNEMIYYDPIGEGKIKPEFVAPEPFTTQVWQYRQTILQDFQRLGNTMGVAQGQMPSGGAKAFRALAYLGAKADEQLGTQRYLWETAHELRYEKCLLLAKRFWDEPRKVKVAGFNGKWGMQKLMGQDLEGDYTLDFVPDSSRPKSPEERAQAFASLLQAGLVDVSDSATREYVIDQASLDNVNLVDHAQYLKAERDLDRLKQGQPPLPSPFLKPDISLKVFATFCLTEEFETLAPEIQQAILGQAQQYQAAIAAAMMSGAAPPNPAQQAQQLGEAMGGGGQGGGLNPLTSVPGETGSPETAEAGATAEGANVASQLA